jgi:hypothetical protein
VPPGHPTLRIPVPMSTRRILLVFSALFFSACKGDNGTGPGEQTTTTLSCAGNGGSSTSCTIPVAGASKVTIEVVSTACQAHGNILNVVTPTPRELSQDACYLRVGDKWELSGPFTGTASLNMSVTSQSFQFPPSLKVTGAAPTWQIVFEDGYDDDQNDVILRVTTS